jgi:pilus assembly protein Flp/PilA
MQGKQFRKREAGQGLVEYALIMVLVAIVVIVILATMGPAIRTVYCQVVLQLNPSGTCTASVAAANEGNGNGNQQQPTVQPTVQPTATTAAGSMSYSQNWGGCSGTCTNSFLTCPSGNSFRFTTTSYPNGDPGMTSVRTCSSGATGFGNFFPGQTISFQNLTSGGSLTITIGAIGS